MAPVFGTVDELQAGKGKFGIELRLIRIYDVPEFKDKTKIFTMECIFHDKKGARVHASIQRPLIAKFKSELEVGKVYAIMEYVGGNHTARYKTTECSFKILIFRHTKIVEVFDDKFPKEIFNFKSFKEIVAIENVQDGNMFDIIGVLVSRYKPQEKERNGLSTRLIDIVLQDVEKNTLACTLWEAYADELMGYLNNDLEGPICIIIQFCRPSSFRGEVRVTNSYCATNVIFDDSLQEIKDFKTKFLENDANNNYLVCSYMPKTLHYSFDEDYDIPLKTISEIQKEGKTGKFWVFAEIYQVDTIGAWAYLACTSCFSKLKPDSQKFICEKYGSKDVEGRKRYQLTIGVADEHGVTSFHLWDRECMALIGKTASDLNPAGELDDLPSEIYSLCGKKALFKVTINSGQTALLIKGEEINKFRGAYNVLKVIYETEEIKAFCGNYSEHQGMKIHFDSDKLEFSKIDPKEAAKERIEGKEDDLQLIGETSSSVGKKKRRLIKMED